MTIKDEIFKLRKKTNGSGCLANKINEEIDLSKRIDDFLREYYRYVCIRKCDVDAVAQSFTDEMKNFIEKVAVWYELRYPSYEINNMMHCTYSELTEVSDEMFKKNDYVNTLLGNDTDAKELDWDEFYNTHAFISSLPWEEKKKFKKPQYGDGLVDLATHEYSILNNIFPPHIHLTKKGIVNDAEHITSFTNGTITDEEIIGMKAPEVLELFKKRGIELPKDNELEMAISSYNSAVSIKEGMLDAIMYRIIERGGSRIGPRRAFLFAKEFGRNIDVPMQYAIDYSDPGLRSFVNEYIKAGGKTTLECYVNYFYCKRYKEPIEKVTVQELIREHGNNRTHFYTEEETALQQRLLNALITQLPPVEQGELRNEDVKRLRLARKIEKSKRK